MVSEKKFCLVKKLQIKDANHYKMPPRSRAVQKWMGKSATGNPKGDFRLHIFKHKLIIRYREAEFEVLAQPLPFRLNQNKMLN